MLGGGRGLAKRGSGLHMDSPGQRARPPGLCLATDGRREERRNQERPQ